MTSHLNPKSPKKLLPDAEGTSFGDELDNLSDFEFPTDKPQPMNDSWFSRNWDLFTATLGQGDLAGFQSIWMLVSLAFFICKLFELTIFRNVEWWTIFVLPLLNAILTGIFDYLMMKWNNPEHVESLIRSRFIFLFAFKLFIAIFVFWAWLFARDGGFIDRFQNDDNWQHEYCVCQVYTVFCACILALIVTELIITTNIVNSEQNLFVYTPSQIRITLLVIRPVVWVYNRAMIMFLSFYVFYFFLYIVLFGVGFICDLRCRNNHCRDDLQIIGVQFLLIPFSRPDYLRIVEEAWQDINKYKDSNLTEGIALTFLVTSFWFDCFNGIVVFTRRFVLPRYFPVHCALEQPQSNLDVSNHLLQTRQSSHHSNMQSIHSHLNSLHLSNENVGAMTRDSSQAESKTSAISTIGPIYGAMSPSVTTGGTGANRHGNAGSHTPGTMVLKDATSASEGFGDYSQRIAKAKQKRLDSGKNIFGAVGANNPLVDVLRKATSLSNIVDDTEDTITANYAMETPVANTNGAATNAAMAAMVTSGMDLNKLSAHNLFLDGNGKHVSISDRGGSRLSRNNILNGSDRSIPGMTTNSAERSVNSVDPEERELKTKKRKTSQRDGKPQTPLEIYRRARASSKHKNSSMRFMGASSVTASARDVMNDVEDVANAQSSYNAAITSLTVSAPNNAPVSGASAVSAESGATGAPAEAGVTRGRKESNVSSHNSQRPRGNSSASRTSERETSLDTDEDYNSPPAMMHDVGNVAAATGGTGGTEGTGSTAGVRSTRSMRHGTGARGSKRGPQNSGNHEKTRTEVVADAVAEMAMQDAETMRAVAVAVPPRTKSKIELMKKLESEAMMEGKNKYERYALKGRKSSNADNSVWGD